MSRGKSRLVAAMTRTFTETSSVPPILWNVPVSRTRRRFDCASGGTSPISSRKRVPPSASSKWPIFCSCAPVNEPSSCPKKAPVIRFASMAPQFTTTNFSFRRLLWLCNACATSSLPTPVSPRISTGQGSCEKRSMPWSISKTCRLSPTMSE